MKRIPHTFKLFLHLREKQAPRRLSQIWTGELERERGRPVSTKRSLAAAPGVEVIRDRAWNADVKNRVVYRSHFHSFRPMKSYNSSSHLCSDGISRFFVAVWFWIVPNSIVTENNKDDKKAKTKDDWNWTVLVDRDTFHESSFLLNTWMNQTKQFDIFLAFSPTFKTSYIPSTAFFSQPIQLSRVQPNIAFMSWERNRRPKRVGFCKGSGDLTRWKSRGKNEKKVAAKRLSFGELLDEIEPI